MSGAAIALALLLAAGCAGGSTGDPAASPTGSAPAASASTGSVPSGSAPAGSPAPGRPGSGSPAAEQAIARTTATEPVTFDGPLEDFYRVPDPLPAAPPGTPIRMMAIEAPAGWQGWRIMYHSTDAAGRDRAGTGLVYGPAEAAPERGWPVLAWAHGTSGLVASCAPSRFPSLPPAFGVRGVLVQPDYLGLGPVGEVHPYLSAAAEGHAVIDEVAAVRTLPALGAGDRWVVAGVSQGGHAALVTGEQAAARLPDATLLGTAAFAPGSQLGETYGDAIQVSVIEAMVLVGAAADDPTVDVADYLGPAGLPAAEVIRTACVQDIVAKVAPMTLDPGFFRQSPRDGALGAAWVAANDPGQVRSPAPILLAQGGQDIIVVPARTDALFARLCAAGQVVERIDVATANHDSIVPAVRDQSTAWVADRFAGRPATSSC